MDARLQSAGVHLGNVVQARLRVVPVVAGWAAAEAVLHVQRIVVVHVVHQVEVAHFVLGGSAGGANGQSGV